MQDLIGAIKSNNTRRVFELIPVTHGSELIAGFKWACLLNQSSHVAEFLADGRVDPDGWAIHVAAEDGDVEIMQLLLADERVDPAVDNSWALCAAAENGHEQILRLLLQDGRCNIHARNNYAMYSAAEGGFLNILDLLKEYGCLPDTEVMISAAEGGHIHVVEYLLREIEPTEAVLWAAAEAGHDDIVARLLVDWRINPAAQDNCAVRLAYENGHNAVVSALMADPRVFWTYSIGIERNVWYLRRRLDFRDLHNELCGRVCTKKQKIV